MEEEILMDVLDALRQCGGKARFDELVELTGFDEVALDAELGRLARRGDIMEHRPGLWLILE